MGFLNTIININWNPEIMSPCLSQSHHCNANIYLHLSNNHVRILHIKQIPIITKANRCTCFLISYRVLLFFSSPADDAGAGGDRDGCCNHWDYARTGMAAHWAIVTCQQRGGAGHSWPKDLRPVRCTPARPRTVEGLAVAPGDCRPTRPFKWAATPRTRYGTTNLFITSFILLLSCSCILSGCWWPKGGTTDELIKIPRELFTASQGLIP